MDENANTSFMNGTQLLAVLLERLAPGQVVRITRADVEAAQFGTTHPVLFTLIDEDTVEMTVERVRKASSPA